MNPSYSAQIPKLRPGDLNNQTVLDRLTDHLNSLQLQAGKGISIRRQGSAGTVVEAATADAVDSGKKRTVHLFMDGSTYCVYCPVLTIMYTSSPNIGNSGLSSTKFSSFPWTITQRAGVTVWRFTSGWPTNIGVQPAEYSDLPTIDHWVHDGADGADAETQRQYIPTSSIKTVMRFWVKNGSTLYSIPESADSLQNYTHWYYNYAQGKIDVRIPELYWGNDMRWYSSSGALLGGPITTIPRAITSSTTYTLYYELSGEWYQMFEGSFQYINLKTSSEFRSGYVYYPAGTIQTDADSRIIKAAGPNILPRFLPLSITDKSGTYVKTVSPLTTGTVTSKNGLVTDIT